MTLLFTPFQFSSLLVTVFSIGLAVFVFYKAPQRKQNQLWLIFSFSVAIWGIGGMLVSIEKDASLALLKWRIVQVSGINWIAPLYLHFICHFLGIRRPKALMISYALAAVFATLSLTPAILGEVRYLWNEMYWPYMGKLHPLFFAWWSGLIFYTHWELWLHCKKSQGIRRSQIKLFFLASIIGYSCGALEYLPDYGIYLYPWGNFGVALYPLIMAYAILQYQLFDISLVIRKSLVYSILVTLLTAGYFGLVYGVERFFQITFGYQSRWLSLTAFALMTLLFQPLKIGIQRLVDWLIFRVPQQELVRRMEKLEGEARKTEKLKAVATLAAGLCHELRNPLQTIRTHAEFLPEHYDDPVFRNKCIEVMCTEIGRIDEFLKQLMEFARPKLPAFRQVEPHKILDSTLDLLSNEFVKRRVHLDKEYQADSLQLQADPDQLRQVVLNLTLI